MGYELYREVRDGAPVGWTATERLVAMLIADDANDRTRKSWIPIEGCWRKGRWLEGLVEQSGLTPRGISNALRGLGAHGYEFRVPLMKDGQPVTGKDGRPVFAAKGHSLDFKVPKIPPRPHPHSPHQREGYVRPHESAGFELSPHESAGFDAQRPHESASKATRECDPFPSDPPLSKTIPSSVVDVDQSSTGGIRPLSRIKINGSQDQQRRHELETKLLGRAVTRKLTERTGVTVSEGWALKTAELILSGAGEAPDDQVKYVLAAIDREPDPGTRFLPITRPGY